MNNDELYELCPICEGACTNELDQPCAWCDGEGLVEHDCERAQEHEHS